VAQAVFGRVDEVIAPVREVGPTIRRLAPETEALGMLIRTSFRRSSTLG
jgi:hypothetical protein